MNEVIIACDFADKKALNEFLARLGGEVKPYLKIGMELFYREGATLVEELKADGYSIFLDLKLHDIPNTVKKAMKNLASLGADIVNCHAAGGVEMMCAAKEGLCAGGGNAKLIAVTQLTSTDQTMLEKELLIEKPLSEVIEHYAGNAKAAGLDGIVCSPLEAPIAKKLGLLSVTPGIRLAGDGVNDQKRVTTPKIARELGSDYIVVGRSITAAENPCAAYGRCVAEFCGND